MEGQCLGIIKPTEKHWGLCCGISSKGTIQLYITACSETGHSVLNNCMTCDASFRQILLPLLLLVSINQVTNNYVSKKRYSSIMNFNDTIDLP